MRITFALTMANKDKTKGEVSDLKAKLAAIIAQGNSIKSSNSSHGHKHAKDGKAGANAANRDPTMVRRNLFKNILHYMTINVDMSGLFTQMIIAATPSDDLVLKKMLYLYICTYAKQKPDLTLLAINTLTKDCGDSDPTVRGLALRSLCSLRVPNLIEYLLTPLKAGLGDRDAYVRRTAVLGVLKVFRLDSGIVEEQEFEQRLKDMFANDNDSQVVANCLSVLKQISNSPQDLITKPVVYSLLNRMKEFSEWSQCIVLDFVSLYRTESSDETFDIMNVLEDRLQHSDSAVVLATVRLFLHLTVSIPDIHQQVLERIKGPLYTMMHNKSPEIAYTVASHLRLLVQRAPMLYSQDYKQFFCRYNDSIHIKKIKLEMLTLVADEVNAYDIVSELCEYATDPMTSVARQSIKAVGSIAMNLRSSDGLVERLLSFLDIHMDHVTAETYIVMTHILRCLPEHAEKCVDALSSLTRIEVVEPEARAAIVWILGSYGEKLQESPYILESIAESFEDENVAVQFALLSASMKLFFKRPPECKELVLEVLDKGMQSGNQDVHDRAILYARLLKKDINIAQSIVCSTNADVTGTFGDEIEAEVSDKLFQDFNSLSVVYNEPASVFITDPDEIVYEGHSYEEEADQESKVQAGGPGDAFADSNLLDLTDDPPVVTSTPQQDIMSLLDLSLDPPEAAMAEVATVPGPTMELNLSPGMDAAAFQQSWSSFTNQKSFTLQSEGFGTKVQGLSEHVKSFGVFTIASGGQAPVFKFYLYATEATAPCTFLVELLADLNAGTVSCLCKSGDMDALQRFSSYFEAKLQEYTVAAQ